MNWSQSKIRFCLKIFDGFISHFLRCSLYKAERKYFFLGQICHYFEEIHHQIDLEKYENVCGGLLNDSTVENLENIANSAHN